MLAPFSVSALFLSLHFVPHETMKYLRRYQYTLIFLALFFAWVLLRPEASTPEGQLYQLTGSTMGTTYRILLTEFPEAIDNNELAEQIQQHLFRIDRELMSIYAEDSELSRFNRSPVGMPFPVSEELAFVVQQALEVSELTAGYFDITVGPLTERWGFGVGFRDIPTDAEVQDLLAGIGYQHVEVSMQPPTLMKSADVSLDLGGIAKGYGADVVADYLDSLGLQSYFVEIGGELRIQGTRPDGSSWVPAIEAPVDGRPQAYQIFYSQGESIAVAGSGDYRNYFEQDGVRYSHEIDPHTGRPVSHRLAAVTVITDSATRGDALSTAFMVMGTERAHALAEELDLAAYFIVRREDGEGFDDRYTHRFSQYLERQP